MPGGFGQRLKRALDRQGWTQAELAGRIGATQPAVSSFIAEKRTPSAETLEAIAEALGVQADWLLRGRAERHSAMSDSFGSMNWYERRTHPDGTRQFGNARVEVFQATLPSFARETGQNSNDAALDGEVMMEYRLGILTGARLQRFKNALHWDTLLPHYQAVASDRHHRTTRRYREGLDLLQSSGSMWVLRVDDYGTTGLLGEDFGEGAFTALVRRSQDSQKRSSSSGGRFGLGSSVLSAASAFDLVLFNSTLSSPADGRTSERFIGRSYFPFHSVNGDEFEGPFFYGISSNQNIPERRYSAWGNAELVNDLWLTREYSGDLGKTGTTALVVGFFDPEQGISADVSPEGILSKLADAFTNAFWPAILRGRLTATFSQYDNDRAVSSRTIDASNINHPFRTLLEPSDSIIERMIPLHIPRAKEADTSAYDHSARLLVQILPDDEASDERVNEVAMWRRPHMVVKYRSLPHLTLGARPFRAALMCGEALALEGVDPTVADSAAEQFLSRAEPPQHDDWTAVGTDLVLEYWGGRKSLKDFDEALRGILRELVAPERERNSDGPNQLRELLALPVDGTATQRRAYVSRLDWLDDRYETLAASIRLSSRLDAKRITIRPLIFVGTETGAGLSLPTTIVGVDNGLGLDDGSVIPNDGARDLVVRLKPEWTSLPVRPDLSALTGDVSVADRSSGDR